MKLWDPNMRGSELRASMEGHEGAVRCITSDHSKVVSGGDDCRVLVFDKGTSRNIVSFSGHDDTVSPAVPRYRHNGKGARGSLRDERETTPLSFCVCR